MKMRKSVISALVDRLGDLRCTIKVHKESEEEVCDQLKKLGPGAYQGTRYDALCAEKGRSTVDIERLARDFNIAPDVLALYTKTTAFLEIRIAIK